MSQSTLTPHVAPRDPALLMQVTPYQLRLLAETVGACETDAQKMAWHGMPPQDKAREVARLLHLWDQQNPGQYTGGAAAPTPPAVQAVPQAPALPTQLPLPIPMPPAPPPQRQPVTHVISSIPPVPAGGPPNFTIPGMPGLAPGAPPQVSAEAAATVQQAATPTPGPGRGRKREPVNNGQATTPNGAAQTEGADLALEVLKQLQQLVAQQSQQGGILETIHRTLSAPTNSGIDDVKTQLKDLGAKVEELQGVANNLVGYMTWVVLMNANLVASKDGCSVVQALSEVINNSSMFPQLVKQALGKQ